MDAPDKPNPLCLALCLPALNATTPTILSTVDQTLRGTRFNEARGTVQIALAEVLNNVVEHGYGGRGFGTVAVTMDVQTTGLSMTVTDWGKAYQNNDIPDGTPPEPDQLQEGGYGWFLIKSLMTCVRYERCSGSNRLSLFLAV